VTRGGQKFKFDEFLPTLFPEIPSSYDRLPLLWAGGFYLPSKNINRASVTIAWECTVGVQEKEMILEQNQNRSGDNNRKNEKFSTSKHKIRWYQQAPHPRRNKGNRRHEVKSNRAYPRHGTTQAGKNQ